MIFKESSLKKTLEEKYSEEKVTLKDVIDFNKIKEQLNLTNSK